MNSEIFILINCCKLQNLHSHLEHSLSTLTTMSPSHTVNAYFPDLQLRRRGGEGWGSSFVLLVLAAFLPSAISSFFPKIRVDLDTLCPSPRSTTVICLSCVTLIPWFLSLFKAMTMPAATSTMLYIL